jgi:hypothetical protein
LVGGELILAVMSEVPIQRGLTQRVTLSLSQKPICSN